jgi:hypothetical protein
MMHKVLRYGNLPLKFSPPVFLNNVGTITAQLDGQVAVADTVPRWLTA